MTLSELKSTLSQLDRVSFVDAQGDKVPSHFHVTEVGQVEKNFIDCGGTMRKESVVSLQLFTANDYDHRLGAEKLNDILQLSERKLGLKDGEIEVEYQSDTVGKYGLLFFEDRFHLVPKQTACLASDQCGIPESGEEDSLGKSKAAVACCSSSNCC